MYYWYEYWKLYIKTQNTKLLVLYKNVPPWVHYCESNRQGHYFELYGTSRSTLLKKYLHMNIKYIKII